MLNIISYCIISHFSCVWLFATSWTVAHQASLPMEFFRQEYWNECHFLLQGTFPTRGLNSCLISLLHWQVCPLPPVPPDSLVIKELQNWDRNYRHWRIHNNCWNWKANKTKSLHRIKKNLSICVCVCVCVCVCAQMLNKKRFDNFYRS